MGFFRRFLNIFAGLAAAVTAGLLMNQYQKKRLYEAEFRVIEPEEEQDDPQTDHS